MTFIRRGYQVFKVKFFILILGALAALEVPAISFWKTSASTSKVNVLNYFNDNSEVALYQFENNAIEKFGNYNGTPSNASYENGKINRAVQLGDGKNIIIPKIFNNATAASFSFWVFPLTAANGITFFGFNVAAFDISYQRGFGFYYDFIAQSYGDALVTADNSFHIYNAGNTNTDIAENLLVPTITKNSWNHVVFIFSQPTLTIYINGVNAGFVTNAAWTYLANWNTTSTNWVIGDTLYTGNVSDTYFDQIRIFNRALTGPEVLQLYNTP